MNEIWNTLKETGEYTPAWEPGKIQESYTACYNLAVELADNIEKEILKAEGQKVSLSTFQREGIKFMIYNTYDFANFKSSMDPGFKESNHCTLKICR